MVIFEKINTDFGSIKKAFVPIKTKTGINRNRNIFIEKK